MQYRMRYESVIINICDSGIGTSGSLIDRATIMSIEDQAIHSISFNPSPTWESVLMVLHQDGDLSEQ